ncbi:GDNF family receptor alpha-2 [Engraulis encrasicolus]|uniref:GDNF family receptor alpha-2 n=1 Tax=Engraulis encrasicolus TaxID=184585 RepID=UPI002FCE9934
MWNNCVHADVLGRRKHNEGSRGAASVHERESSYHSRARSVGYGIGFTGGQKVFETSPPTGRTQLVLFVLDELVHSLVATSYSSSSSSSSSDPLSGPGTHGWHAPLDCVRANEMCNQNAQCSSRYRIMRQCLVGKDRTTMLANRECQAALEVLQDYPLYDCRCKRGMKKELQCLQNYWSIHMGLDEDEEFYETSPYEPLHPSDEFRLASIISAIDSASSKGNLCSDTGSPCNPCLDAAKACNLNDTCKRQRSQYIAACHSKTSPLQHPNTPCNRKRCHKHLRQFFERVQSEFSYPLLFCACRDMACAERRRQTIVPSCSFDEKSKPNCLELRRTCRSDSLCRSRLADFHMNCQMSPHTKTTCEKDNYYACLISYVGLIGMDITPNYVDASHSNFTISLWCSCRGSGNQEGECDAFLRDFRDNTCLRNAIQAFGYGSEAGIGHIPMLESHHHPHHPPHHHPPPPGPSSLPPGHMNLQPAIITKPSINSNDVKPVDSNACDTDYSTCANLKDGDKKCTSSDAYECTNENLLEPSLVDGAAPVGSHQAADESARQSAATGPLQHPSTAALLLLAGSLLLHLLSPPLL